MSAVVGVVCRCGEIFAAGDPHMCRAQSARPKDILTRWLSRGASVMIRKHFDQTGYDPAFDPNLVDEQRNFLNE